MILAYTGHPRNYYASRYHHHHQSEHHLTMLGLFYFLWHIVNVILYWTSKKYFKNIEAKFQNERMKRGEGEEFYHQRVDMESF